MALQTSGAISISQIKTELGSSSNSLRTLSAAAGKSAPDAMSEFYGYSAYTGPSYFSGASSISGAGTAANNFVVTPSWYNDSQEEVDVSVEYGYEPGTALWYYVSTGWFLNFKPNTPATIRANSKITTWNNNAQSGCVMSNAAHYIYGDVPYVEQNESSECGGCNGTANLINDVLTTGYSAVTVNSNIFIAGYARQFYMEIFQGAYYYYCQSSVSTFALTVRVWFDKQ